MKQKRIVALLTAVVCLLGLMAGMLSGCRNTKLQVSFDMNWKDAVSVPESIEVRTGQPYGQLPQIAADSREGYTFGGWYLEADCEGEEVTADTVVTAQTDHVLYAKWIGDQITVSFDLQGGNINGVSTVEDAVVTVGNVYSMMAIPEDPQRDNHSFLGWYYDPEGTEGPVITSTKVEKTEDHTLYAVWNEYSLFYDFEDNGGTEVFTVASNLQFAIENFNGSNQLKVSNPGTDKPEGTLLMWLPLKMGTRVTMDLTFDGALPAELSRMYLFCYGVNESGVAMTEGLIDINESEIHRRWYHGNGFRAMQENGTWFYGDEGNWTEGNTCKFEMIVMEDCAGLYMNFCLGSELEQAQFEKNAIYLDNIEFTPNYYRILEDGMMGTSPYGSTEKGIYFTMKDNGLPYDSDWKVYYSATTADNVKLIRNGSVYRIAEVGCDNICKFSLTDYYLRLEEFTIGPAAPISTSDMFIVEGDFVNGNSVLSIKKTYIYHNGTAWVCADLLPEELAPASEIASDFPDPYYGILRSHEGGAAEGGIHFRLSDNGLPYGDWDVYYDATTPDNIKLIRDGKAYAVAQVGCDNICKFGKDSYYLRLEGYTIGAFAPYTTEDIIIVQGDFVYEGYTLTINKTYIYYNGFEWVFTTRLPAELAPESEDPVTPDDLPDGVPGSSALGATDMGIYFTMKDNGLPFGDWDVYYDATTADSIKIIRDGKVYAVASVGCDNICKFSATDYYLRLESYTIGGFAPFSTEDIFIIQGDFTYEKSTLTVKKTYIYHDGNTWVFAAELPQELKPETEEPSKPVLINDGLMHSSPNGATDMGIYFTMRDNGLPYGDWDVYYDATTADNIKIIRDGKVYAAALVGCDNICKFSATDYYLRLESYTIGSYAPLSNKDIFIVEGDFVYEDTVLTLKKNYIYHDGNGWVFATKLPQELKPETEEPVKPELTNDGLMHSSPNGATDMGIYFTMKDNGLPFGDWDVYYGATATDNVKLIRNNQIYSVAQVGRDNICKFSATDYYLRLESYTIGGYAPFSETDIFVVEGDFVHGESVLALKKNYIYHDGNAWVFATELPEDLQPDIGGGEDTGKNELGVLSAHANGVNMDGGSVKGIYATGAATSATFNTDWSVEYTPAAAENYKLIRDGVSYNVGVPGNGTIVMFGQTELYLKQEGHTFGDGSLLPIRDGDILVVEGQWNCNQDAASSVMITTTYILIENGTAVFSDTKPGGDVEDPGKNELGVLSAHAAGVNMDGGSVKGIYATGAATNATFNTDWSVEYTPAAAENYKLIRDGVSYNVGVPGSGTLVMFGQTDLYLKQEGHTFGDGSLLPIRDGDILVVEGQWNCNQDAASTVTITKTCILINGDTATFYAGEPDEEGGEGTEDQKPGLSAHAAGVNVDGGAIKGIYATCEENDATFNTDWSVEYTPAAAENYKLIRDGVTYNVGVPGSGTIVLFGQTEVYLKQEGHTFGDGSLLPIRDGDILVVEGQWNCNQDASSTLTIATTYILIRNNTAEFSGKLPGETLPDEEDPADGQWPFGFDNGTVSTDVFKLRDSDLSMTVEELNGSMQLRLQPTIASGKYWLWLDQELKAGTVITMDVTFQRKLGTMNIYLYGAKENGDPITEGTASDTVPQVWFDGQGVAADFTGGNTNTQKLTFTVYEDCHGIAFMLGYGNKKPNVIYLDNIAKQSPDAEDENGLGVLSAHSAGVAADALTGAIKGIYATGAATNATFNTDWSVEYTPAAAGNYKLIRDGVTYDVGVPGNGTIVLFGQTELYLKQEGHTFGDGSLLPIRAGDILVIDGQWICNQDPASTVSITKTYILITDNSVVFSDQEDDFES